MRYLLLKLMERMVTTLQEDATIGQFICEMRKSKGLTQKQLAQRLNVTDKAVSKWERGQGYPDILSLSALAEELGVTTNELLSGARAEVPLPAADSIIHNTLDYADRLSKTKKNTRLFWVTGTLTVVFLAAMFVCALCDLLLTDRFTWSIYPITSMAFAWLVLVPLLRFQRHRVLAGLVSVTIFILPFLFVILRQAGVAQFYWNLAVPAAITGLAYLWALCITIVYMKLNRWHCGAVSVLLLSAVSIAIDVIVSRALSEPFPIWNLAGVVLTVVIAWVLIAVGRKRSRGN